MLSNHKEKILNSIQIMFELTHRCNFNCFHCCIPKNLKKKELSFDQICRILDELHKEGVIWLCFSGGEPLLRNDFKDIYVYAKKKGFLVSVSTNCSLLNKDIVNVFRKYKPRKINITLYGIDEISYKDSTNTKGNFRKVNDNIDILIKNKIPCGLRTLLTKMNYWLLKDLISFAESRNKYLSVGFLIFGGLDIKRNKSIFEKCRIPKNLIGKIEHDLLKYRGRLKNTIQIKNNLKPRNQNPFIFRCEGGRSYLAIDPFGNVSACTNVRKPSYNLLKFSFNYARKRIYKYVTTKKFPKGHKCATCSYYGNVCSMCPGWSEREYGTHDKVVEYICKLQN